VASGFEFVSASALILTFSPRRRNRHCLFSVLRITVRQTRSRGFSSSRGIILPLLGGEGRGEVGNLIPQNPGPSWRCTSIAAPMTACASSSVLLSGSIKLCIRLTAKAQRTPRLIFASAQNFDWIDSPSWRFWRLGGSTRKLSHFWPLDRQVAIFDHFSLNIRREPLLVET
jgi:hypothetical protein